MSVHSFDTEIAEKYGVNAAILFYHIVFWIEKNEANETNYHDGHYWTYNSIKAFKTLFPYMGEKQIRNALKKLTDEGLIITGNYNKSPCDRTMWYSLTEKAVSILPKGRMEIAERAHENSQKGEPIPDNKPDVKPDAIEDTKVSSLSKNKFSDKKYTSKDIVDLYHNICKSYPKVKALSEKRKTAIKVRLNNYGYDAIKEVFEKAEASDFLRGKNSRNWMATFDWLIVSDNNFCKVLDGNYDNGRIGSYGKNNRQSQPDVDTSWAAGETL